MQQQQQQTRSMPVLGTPALSSLRFDTGAYQADLRQSVGPGQYVLSPLSPPRRPCLSHDARRVQGTVGDSLCMNSSLVDVESDLQNLTRPATLAPGGLYRGNGAAPTTCSAVSTAAFPTCEGLAAVDTRLANPPCTLRGTGWNRWEWLCRNPQDNAMATFSANVDTSIVIKDNHRPVIARPVDPTMAMPPGKNDASASVGAPQWMPKTCNGVGNVDEPPEILWRSCAEVARITNGCQA